MEGNFGVAHVQLARSLGLIYKTAWFMAQSVSIREAMAPVLGSEPPLGGEGFVVEADEAYIGKKDGKRKRPRVPAVMPISARF